MKKIVVLVLSVALLLTMVGCGETQSSADSETEALESQAESTQATPTFTTDKVVMTYVASPLNVPSVIEKQRGDYATAFSALGLSFEYSDLDSGADQTAALASGSIQILNAVGGSSVILAAANGADIRIISMYSAAPKAFAMFSNDSSLTTPESLRGKTIAGPKGTNLHELLVAYLATAGMTTEDVNFVSMDIPSASAALENGSIDVALLGGAPAYNCEKSGKYKITDGEGLIPATIVTATTKEFADENPEIIKTFRATQNELVSYMLSNEEEALQMTADALGLELQAVKDMYSMYDFSTDLVDEDISAIQATADFLYNNGLIESPVDVKDIVL